MGWWGALGASQVSPEARKETMGGAAARGAERGEGRGREGRGGEGRGEEGAGGGEPPWAMRSLAAS